MIIYAMHRYAKNPYKIKKDFSKLFSLYSRYGALYCLSLCRAASIPKDKTAMSQGLGAIEAKDFVPLTDKPFISVIIVNYNGREHLKGLANCLERQTYRNFEIIFVDNASTDNSISVMAAVSPQAKLIQTTENIGFAEGNNIGLDHAIGELIAILNNDTEVAPDWLEQMVACMRRHPRCAAIAPKILFWKPFCTMHIESSHLFALDVQQTQSALRHYTKVLLARPARPSTTQVIRLPEGEFPVRLFCRMDKKPNALPAFIVNAVPCPTTDLGDGTYAVSISREVAGMACDIINNAATVIDRAGQCADRGIGQEDRGQFEREEVVAALCGCAALVRRVALGRLPLFCPEFFAYFEDTELSTRLTKAGAEIWYCPRAMVRHKHASTSREWSPFFRYYVERNRTLFVLMRTKNLVHRNIVNQKLEQLKQQEKEALLDGQDNDFRVFAQRIPELRRSLPILASRIESGTIFHRKHHGIKVGIFNKYWTTLGGAEMHAALIALHLRNKCIVDLISESDFSIQDIQRRFLLDLPHCRKLVIDNFTEDDTRCYDFFINSTFLSSLPSAAKKSLYIVNFPQKQVSSPFLASYDMFLSNSAFTKAWTMRYWSSAIPITTFYPGVPEPQENTPSYHHKKRIILGVGRFFRGGHNKKQREMVEVFRAIKKSCSQATDWKLVLAGGVNYACPDDVRYFESVRQAARDADIILCPNIARDDLITWYRQAAIFWHFAGMDIDEEQAPEQVEHFGITTVEAMMHGCVPIVPCKGGQPEVVGTTFTTNIFLTQEDAQGITTRILTLYENNSAEFTQLCHDAHTQAITFNVSRHRTAFFKILEQLSQTMFLPSPPAQSNDGPSDIAGG